MKQAYDLYVDPSHGWLRVRYQELVDLGIEKKITSYSYIRGEHVYLEEDLDMSTFHDAKIKEALKAGTTYKPNYRSHYTSKQSKIRGYDCYPYGAPR